MKASNFIKFVAGAIAVKFLFSKAIALQEVVISKLENKISLLKEEIPLIYFQILKRTTGGFEFRYKVANSNDVKSLYLPGIELFFDFTIVKISNRFLAFPTKIFTDQLAPNSGVSILNLDTINAISRKFSLEQNVVAELVNVISRSNNYSKVAIHDINGLGKFEVGQTYKIFLHTVSGAVEVVAINND